MSKLRVLTYARDLSILSNKFDQLDRLVADVKNQKQFADAVLVQSPEVLGDTYDELVANMNKLAEANLAVVVVPPSFNAKSQAARN